MRTGENGRAFDVAADEGVDDRPGESVDGDLDQAQRPDGLDVVFRGVHFGHEAVLADRERVGEDDVRQGQECRGERDVCRGPGGPGNGRQSSRGFRSFDSGRDHGDEDGRNDGDEVNVAQNREFVERGRKREAVKHDGGHHAPDQGAQCRLIDDTDPCDGAGENVGAGEEDEKEDEHDTGQFVAKATPHQAHGIGVMLDVGMLQPDLTDDIAGVDGDEPEAHGHDDTSHHP